MLRFFSKKLRNRKGFTLIELIVVIAILGILAMIAVPRFAGTQLRAQERAHNANVRTIESAVAVYQAETGVALTTIDDFTNLVPGYLAAIPTNPLPAGHARAGVYTLTDGIVAPVLAP